MVVACHGHDIDGSVNQKRPTYVTHRDFIVLLSTSFPSLFESIWSMNWTSIIAAANSSYSFLFSKFNSIELPTYKRISIMNLFGFECVGCDLCCEELSAQSWQRQTMSLGQR